MTTTAWASFVTAILVSGGAAADGRATGRFDILPSGELRVEANDQKVKEDSDTAFGIGGTLEFPASPNIMIGFAPRLLFNVKGETGTDSAKQLDLAVRAKAVAPISPTATVYGFLSPGYSMIFLPDGDSGVDETPKGLIIGIGMGADIAISPTSFINLELGHTWGFQGGNVQGTDYTLATNFLHLGFGFGSKF